MPKHRKRRIMLSIVSIVLFVVLSAQLSTFSFSVTAAGEHGELVAEEYERYRERFDRIEKIGDLEDQGFRLLEDQIFAMPLQKLPEEAQDRKDWRFGGPGIPPAGGSDLCDAVAKTSGGSRRYDRGTRG